MKGRNKNYLIKETSNESVIKYKKYIHITKGYCTFYSERCKNVIY